MNCKKPSVSELIDLLNKPALLKWANKIGLQGIHIDDYRKRSTSDGTDKHKFIEDDLKHGIIYQNPCFQLFKSKYEVVSVEPEIYCEHYCGRADVLLKRDNKLWLFDFKSSNRIYFEQKLQLVAYKRVLNPDKIGIVNTDSFMEYIIDISSEEEREYLNILGALTIIYKAKNKIGF